VHHPVNFDIKLLVGFDTDLSKYFKISSVDRDGKYWIQGLLSTNMVRATKIGGKTIYWYSADVSHVLYAGDKFKQVIIRCRIDHDQINLAKIKQVLTRMTGDDIIIAKEGDFLGTACEDGNMPELYLFPDTWVSPKLNNE
jgi:hypothetical protein